MFQTRLGSFVVRFRISFLRFSNRFSCQIKIFSGAISFCRRAALNLWGRLRQNCVIAKKRIRRELFCVIGTCRDLRLFHVELREVYTTPEKPILRELFCVIDCTKLSQSSQKQFLRSFLGLVFFGCSFFAYSWKLPAYSWSVLLTIDNLSFFRFQLELFAYSFSFFAYSWSLFADSGESASNKGLKGL